MTDTTSTGSPTFRWGSVPTHLFCALWGKQGSGRSASSGQPVG